MAQPPDIRVRKGAGRPHRVNLALDRLRERQGPTTLRVLIQANLPRGQGRPSRLQYQRVGSWLIDCGNPEAVAHVRAELAGLMDALAHPEKNKECSPAHEAVAQAPARAADDPGRKAFLHRIAQLRGEAPASPAPPEPAPPKPTPLTVEDRDPWLRLRLF